MASIAPLNEFKSIPFDITTSPTIVYTTPIAVATIVLKIQVANVSSDSENVSNVTVSHVRSGKRTRVVFEGPVLANDFSIVSDGKLVLQEGDSLEVSGSADDVLEMIVSYLETSA
jgi:hypothetical protein